MPVIQITKSYLGWVGYKHLDILPQLILFTATALINWYSQSCERLKDAEQVFENLSSTFNLEMRKLWQQEIEEAKANWYQNPAVMDIMASCPMEKNQVHDISPQGMKENIGNTWILVALGIEERQ